MLNSLIDYAELYVPKLSKSKELRLLEEAAIIEKDKNEILNEERNDTSGVAEKTIIS